MAKETEAHRIYMQKYNRERYRKKKLQAQTEGVHRAESLIGRLEQHKCVICKDQTTAELCRLCREGLAFFNSDPGLLTEAIAYLIKPPLTKNPIKFIPSNPKTRSKVIQQYDTIVGLLGELCNICKRSVPGRLDRDHNHRTGYIRGLLCPNCNQGLGRFKENPNLLESTVYYLSTSTL